MNSIKENIKIALKNFSYGELESQALALFNTLGYCSKKYLTLEPPIKFLEILKENGRILDQEKAIFTEWQTILFYQLTDEEIFTFSNLHGNAESYLFLAIGLQKENYGRSELSKITKEINKQFPMPILILYKHGNTLSLSILDKRNRDKVTLIKGIYFVEPHPIYVEMLYSIHLEKLESKKINSFLKLHEALRNRFTFYEELYLLYLESTRIPCFTKNSNNVKIRSVINLVKKHKIAIISRLLNYLLENSLIKLVINDCFSLKIDPVFEEQINPVFGELTMEIEYINSIKTDERNILVGLNVLLQSELIGINDYVSLDEPFYLPLEVEMMFNLSRKKVDKKDISLYKSFYLPLEVEVLFNRKTGEINKIEIKQGIPIKLNIWWSRIDSD
ncbi:MAG: hypothetical protein BWK79_13740 [Beggiatoa sp. IS2]|nr:MAG: hypothetical protein BWK79_13740 [Beggiatoa sp. IS2]